MSAEGNQESVDKAKSILVSSITSLVILFVGYILLKAINPDLVQFQNIQPPSVVVGGGVETGGTPTAEAKSTAAQILANSGNIILADNHQSGISDNATALKNVQDTAAGNAASRSSYQGAPGGTVALNPNMLAALLAIGKQYKINVSEIAGGSHSADNTGPRGHYGGNAFDITHVNGTLLAPGGQYVKALMDLCTSLGARQVIDETATASHVHCGDFPPASTPGPIGGGMCLFSNIDFCQGRATDALGHTNECGTSICSQYNSAIQSVAQSVNGLASANVLKTIMFKESGCLISPPNSGAGAYGLMQIQVGTAETYKTRCGVSSSTTITPQWLQNQSNAQATICMAANYLNYLATTNCGHSLADVLAGYGGGTGSCERSVNCATQNGCDGTPMRKWECLYEDNAHTICNGDNTVFGPSSGYNESRNSVMTKLYCIDHPGF